MKILYFIDRIDTPGGMERVLTLKANYLVEKLHCQVQIVIKNEDNKPPFFKLHPAIKVHNLNLKTVKRKPHEAKVRALIYQESPDICITLMGMEVYFLHKIKDGSKKIAEFHNAKQSMIIQAEESRLVPLKKIYRKWLVRKLTSHIKKYDRFINLTHEDQKDWGYLENSQVIANPITFSIKNTLPNYSSKIILSVGRISYQKGFEYLVKVWKIVYSKYPDWKLIILGRRNDNDNLDDYIKQHKLENVIQVHPAVPNIQEYYKKSSIYTATSRYEGFPMTLLEAAAYGLPIVTWKCPTGPAEIVNHKEDGLLSEYMNIQALANNLMELMADEQKRKQYGQAAQENIQRFSMENIMKQWEKLLKELY